PDGTAPPAGASGRYLLALLLLEELDGALAGGGDYPDVAGGVAGQEAEGPGTAACGRFGRLGGGRAGQLHADRAARVRSGQVQDRTGLGRGDRPGADRIGQVAGADNRSELVIRKLRGGGGGDIEVGHIAGTDQVRDVAGRGHQVRPGNPDDAIGVTPYGSSSLIVGVARRSASS